MPAILSDAPLPEGCAYLAHPLQAVLTTDEAETIHAPFIALYFESLPRRPIMIAAAPED